MKRFVFVFIVLTPLLSTCQRYSRKDTLRGSITPERVWWNLIHYDLKVEVDPEKHYLIGSNTIEYEVLEMNDKMQIDLQSPMKIDRIVQNGKEISFSSDGNAHFLEIKQKQKIGNTYKLVVYFSGNPRIAKHPPWDGGFTWKKDLNGNHFIANSNQGIGASVWWPNKDHDYDEPDNGMDITVITSKELTAVSNGRLIGVDEKGQNRAWHWRVVNPINNYGVNINIGDYVKFGEKYEGEKGTLDMNYYVLRENLDKAKEQFKQAPMMMRAFEHWFGPYPFYEDSFKLVEVPYLGMEHQSSVTYGNKYANGYLGRDLSGTGWGLKFDFIIIHESGHEWFANNITNSDVADMWIHEGFTAYSENLYLDYYFGKKASADYVIGTRTSITNNRPIIGEYGVNQSGGNDMYYKGANILHTLRQLIEDDEKWRFILRSLNEKFYHQTVSSNQVEDHISELSGIDLTEFFNQYLRTTMIPKLECKIDGNSYSFRYKHIIDKFDMPLIIYINDKPEWIFPTNMWKTQEFTEEVRSIEVKRDFYVDYELISNN